MELFMTSHDEDAVLAVKWVTYGEGNITAITVVREVNNHTTGSLLNNPPVDADNLDQKGDLLIRKI